MSKSYDITWEPCHTGMVAIKARIVGEFDNPMLMSYGPLSTSVIADILGIIELSLDQWEKDNDLPS